jgi:hypothetical protein
MADLIRQVLCPEPVADEVFRQHDGLRLGAGPSEVGDLH